MTLASQSDDGGDFAAEPLTGQNRSRSGAAPSPRGYELGALTSVLISDLTTKWF